MLIQEYSPHLEFPGRTHGFELLLLLPKGTTALVLQVFLRKGMQDPSKFCMEMDIHSEQICKICNILLCCFTSITTPSSTG